MQALQMNGWTVEGEFKCERTEVVKTRLTVAFKIGMTLWRREGEGVGGVRAATRR